MIFSVIFHDPSGTIIVVGALQARGSEWSHCILDLAVSVVTPSSDGYRMNLDEGGKRAIAFSRSAVPSMPNTKCSTRTFSLLLKSLHVDDPLRNSVGWINRTTLISGSFLVLFPETASLSHLHSQNQQYGQVWNLRAVSSERLRISDDDLRYMSVEIGKIPLDSPLVGVISSLKIELTHCAKFSSEFSGIWDAAGSTAGPAAASAANAASSMASKFALFPPPFMGSPKLSM
mmetsp:Transcript_24206/g.50488  ORF Transcript_24206/g.50488 Transcript_24206/m.50488 type:complete len:231 (-) Transcript_24206:1094-1786(-)